MLVSSLCSISIDTKEMTSLFFLRLQTLEESVVPFPIYFLFALELFKSFICTRFFCFDSLLEWLLVNFFCYFQFLQFVDFQIFLYYILALHSWYVLTLLSLYTCSVYCLYYIFQWDREYVYFKHYCSGVVTTNTHRYTFMEKLKAFVNQSLLQYILPCFCFTERRSAYISLTTQPLKKLKVLEGQLNLIR